MRSLSISLIAHGVVLGIAAYLVDDAPVRDEAIELVEVDVVDVQRPTEPDPVDPPAVVPPGEPGAAGSPRKRGTPRRAERPSPPPPDAPDEPAEDPIPAPPASVTDALGLQVGNDGLGGMSEEGLGLGGFGNGPGRGFGGDGDGTGGGGAGATAATEGVAKKSRARPARLIYPRRFRSESEGDVFVVLLKVDADGAVQGVKLKRGVNPHQDEKALDAVWRFRYDPARDDDGRPIASRVEQRFMVDGF